MSAEEKFFDRVDKLNKLRSQHDGSPSVPSEIRALLEDPDVRREFFKTLESPDWISALHEAGYFDHPPTVRQVEGAGIRYTGWPASNYLARMATKAPAKVAPILAKVETDNPFVVGDVLAAALAMPANVSASLVPGICRAARKGTLWIHFKDASDLCVRLAEGAQLDSAMQLAEGLFTPKFERGQEEPSRLNQYWYKEGMKKVVPLLSKARARTFLPKLCEWLKASVEAKKHIDRNSGHDYSDIWRPAIEEHEQNHDYDFAGAMVGYVRGGFDVAIGNECLSLAEAIQIIEHYRYLVFRRIWLHLIGEFAEQDPTLARQVMLDRALFQDSGCKHEYAMLLGQRFIMLEPPQQAQWLGWVRNGPTDKLANAINDIEEPDARQQRRDYWRFQRLHWIRDHLTGEDQRFYREMHDKCGEPEMADLNVRIGPVRSGSESPMTIDELGAMTFEQAVDVVSSWKPRESRFMGPSVGGLASTFRQYVATDPERFSKEAMVLTGRPDRRCG